MYVALCLAAPAAAKIRQLKTERKAKRSTLSLVPAIARRGMALLVVLAGLTASAYAADAKPTDAKKTDAKAAPAAAAKTDATAKTTAAPTATAEPVNGDEEETQPTEETQPAETATPSDETETLPAMQKPAATQMETETTGETASETPAAGKPTATRLADRTLAGRSYGRSATRSARTCGGTRYVRTLVKPCHRHTIHGRILLVCQAR